MDKRVFLLILIYFGLSLAACSGQLTGSVFLDKNGNNQKDEEDPDIANIPYKITLDEQDVLSERTAYDGTFYTIVDKTGTYCVVVSEEDLITTSAQTSMSPIVLSTSASMTVSSAPKFNVDTGEADPESGADDEADSAGDSQGSSGSGGTITPTTTSTATIQSGEACDTPMGIMLEMNVPIAVDYKSAIAAIETPTKKVVSPGDVFTIDVQYPKSCTFDLIYLSSSLTPQDMMGAYYDATTGQFNFNAAIEAAGESSLETSTPLSINVDPIVTYPLALKVDADEISLESKSVTISPTVKCPDGSKVSLKTHSIEITSDGAFDVTQSWSSDTASATYGSEITVKTVVENTTGAAYTADNIELVLSTTNITQLDSVTSTSSSASCTLNGQKATCSFPLAANSSLTVYTKYTLPTSLVSNTSFVTSASLTVDANGSSATYDGDTASVTLLANTTP